LTRKKIVIPYWTMRKTVRATTMSWFMGALHRAMGTTAIIPTGGMRISDRKRGLFFLKASLKEDGQLLSGCDRETLETGTRIKWVHDGGG
jgi:hypothetical protein